MKLLYSLAIISIGFVSCQSAKDETETSKDDTPELELASTEEEAEEVEECGAMNSFVPEGWKIIEKANGDLNKDGISDAAFVIQETNPDNITVEYEIEMNKNPRELLILFGTAESDCYTLNTRSETFIVTHEDEIMDDPFQGIEIVKGTLKIEFNLFYNMGSWTTSGYTYVWRFQDDSFKLIGANSTEFHRGDGGGTDFSANFSTNKYSITRYNMFDESVKEEVEWKKLDLKELKTFETFKAPWTWTINSDLTF